MVACTKHFGNLTAADLMSRAVVNVPQEMSLRAAAHLLRETQISGAPVVDSTGRCVGVLSTTDFLRVVEQRPPARAGHSRPLQAGCVCADWQTVVDQDGIPDDCVSSYMTCDPVMVDPEACIGELARLMIEAHIHRIVVVDTRRRPIGIVSSTDILGAVARWTPEFAEAGIGGHIL